MIELAYEIAFRKGITPKAIVSKDGSFILANNAYCRLLEYSEAELMKLRFQDITDPEDVRVDEFEAERVAAGKIESYEMIKSYITKRKHLVKVLLRVDGVRDADGKFLCFVAQCKRLEDTQQLSKIDTHRPLKMIIWINQNAKWLIWLILGLMSLAGWVIAKVKGIDI